jgi:hypothetical protein
VDRKSSLHAQLAAGTGDGWHIVIDDQFGLVYNHS